MPLDDGAAGAGDHAGAAARADRQARPGGARPDGGRHLLLHGGRIAGRFGGGNRPPVALANPISADLDVMRPSILPNLLQAAARNAARGFADVALFEVGPQYADDTPRASCWWRPACASAPCARATGRRSRAPSMPSTPRPMRWRCSRCCGAPVDNLQVTTDAPGWYHPGRSGVLRLGPTVLAQFGELHPRVLRELDVKGPPVGFELFLERVPLPQAKGKPAARPLLEASPYQPVERDFAFVVAADVPAEKLLRAAKGADKALIRRCRCSTCSRAAASATARSRSPSPSRCRPWTAR